MLGRKRAKAAWCVSGTPLALVLLYLIAANTAQAPSWRCGSVSFVVMISCKLKNYFLFDFNECSTASPFSLCAKRADYCIQKDD